MPSRQIPSAAPFWRVLHMFWLSLNICFVAIIVVTGFSPAEDLGSYIEQFSTDLNDRFSLYPFVRFPSTNFPVNPTKPNISQAPEFNPSACLRIELGGLKFASATSLTSPFSLAKVMLAVTIILSDNSSLTVVKDRVVVIMRHGQMFETVRRIIFDSLTIISASLTIRSECLTTKVRMADNRGFLGRAILHQR